MNKPVIFNNSEFGEIRVIRIGGEPWFVGKDVAEALGYAKSENAIAAHVDAEDKTTTSIQGKCRVGKLTKKWYNEGKGR